jgi:hypothetical protein
MYDEEHKEWLRNQEERRKKNAVPRTEPEEKTGEEEETVRREDRLPSIDEEDNDYD